MHLHHSKFSCKKKYFALWDRALACIVYSFQLKLKSTTKSIQIHTINPKVNPLSALLHAASTRWHVLLRAKAGQRRLSSTIVATSLPPNIQLLFSPTHPWSSPANGDSHLLSHLPSWLPSLCLDKPPSQPRAGQHQHNLLVCSVGSCNLQLEAPTYGIYCPDK